MWDVCGRIFGSRDLITADSLHVGLNVFAGLGDREFVPRLRFCEVPVRLIDRKRQSNSIYVRGLSGAELEGWPTRNREDSMGGIVAEAKRINWRLSTKRAG